MLEGIAAAISSAEASHFWIGFGIYGLIMLALLYLFLRNLGRARLIEDTPTSLIRSAAQGFVELEGIGRLLPGDPIVSPISGNHCLWWHYSIEKKVTHDRKTRWQTIEKRYSDSLFALEDDTAACIIDPDGADVRPSKKRHWYGNQRWPSRGPRHRGFSIGASYRYNEQLILENDPLYTLGQFHTQRATAGHFDESSEVNALMREWKSDKEKLLKHFDTNKDGEIDMREWEAARRVAMKRVRDMELEQASMPGLHVLSKPTDKHPFVISTTPQHVLIRRFRALAILNLLLFLAAMAGLAWTLKIRALI